jgi:transcriptional regulator with XRE-family HTH domain
MKPIEPSVEIRTRAYDQLGKAIRRFRKLRGWSQSELSQKARITQAQISLIESGKRSPEASTIYHLCAVLGIDVILRPRKSEES